MTVQPHEPVGHQWASQCGVWSFSFSSQDRVGGLCARGDDFIVPCRVTLANGQRIIVRALSEERKAVRRARRDSRGMTAMERFKWKS